MCVIKEKSKDIHIIYFFLSNYKKYNSCLHIGAILWHYKDTLFKDNDLDISNKFLKKYNNILLTNKIKLNLEIYIEFNPSHIKYWLKIGNEHLYTFPKLPLPL